MTYITTQKSKASTALPIAISNLLKWAAHRVAEHTRRQRLVKDTGKLRERHLRDVSLTGNDIEMISRMPLVVDAQKELSSVAKSRSRNW